MPSDKMLQQYYDQDYWQSGQLKSSTFLDTLYQLRMAPIVSAIRKYTTYDSKILDWGCGDGSFIRLLRNFGLHCFGIDAYKRDLNDPQISSTTIEKADFPDEYFDIITCFHVLEHLADPLTSIKHALRLLKKGGLIIIEVPNLDSIGFQIFKRRWQPLEIPTHLNHFTPATLQKVFETAGKIHIVKTEFFSHRISPSALVLSAFSSLSPRRTRRKIYGPLSLSIYRRLFNAAIARLSICTCGLPYRDAEKSLGCMSGNPADELKIFPSINWDHLFFVFFFTSMLMSRR